MADEIKRTVTRATDEPKKAADTAKKTASDAAKKTTTAASTAAKKTTTAASTAAKKTTTAAKKTAEAASDAVKKTGETLEKKTTSSSGKKVTQAKESGNPTLYRILAAVFWLIALACEVLAIMVILERLELPLPILWGVIIFLVVDLIFCVLASQFWKKANHIDPISEKNKTKFWLWNNMGVIMAAVCFLPFIILTLTNKKADKKTKLIATIAAVVCMLIAGLTGYDWNPVSAEEKASAEHVLENVDVYWSAYGHRYHLDENCSSLSRSANLTVGNVDQAIAANKTHLCKFCFNNHADEYEGLETLIAGGSN